MYSEEAVEVFLKDTGGSSGISGRLYGGRSGKYQRSQSVSG